MSISSRSLRAGLALGLAGFVAATTVSTAGAATTTSTRAVAASYSCKVAKLDKTYTFAAKFTGDTPATVSAGSTVNMTHLRAQLTFPAAMLQYLAKDLKATFVSGEVQNVYVVAGTQSKGLSNGFSFTRFTISATSKGHTVAAPSEPVGETVGPFTAGAAGSKLTFTTGQILLNIHTDSTQLSGADITCTAKPAATISTTSVS
jgi:hypothetical protein